MSRLLAVDPGVRGCGCSLWQDEKLVRAEYVIGSSNSGGAERANAWNLMAQAVQKWAALWGVDNYSILAIEAPRTYGGRSSRGDTQDLLDLSCVVGALCFAFRALPTRVYYPQEHKGQLPKKIAHQRTLARLSAEESAAIVKPAKSLLHNVLDAVQIGIVHLRRM